MKKLLCILGILLLLPLSVHAQAPEETAQPEMLDPVPVTDATLSAQERAFPAVPILCYHDIGDAHKNPYSLPISSLRRHFDILRSDGYTPISAQQYMDAREGKGSLPAKPVLLSFDDGYISFYTKIFPLLKEYHYPAVMAIITSWQQTGAVPGYGAVINWDQMREMDASGLVTFSSHSYNMHNYVPINADGDRQEAFSALRYQNSHRETLPEYKQRVQTDMATGQRIFEKELGHPVFVYTWPYGEYTRYAADIARQEGFRLFFTLGSDVTTPIHWQESAPRIIIYGDPNPALFRKQLQDFGKTLPMRGAQLDLDSIYDPVPAQLEQNLQDAMAVLYASGTRTVFLQAFADDNGDGNIQKVYFQTTSAPVKADIFSHVSQRLRQEGFRVYAWVPTLSGQWLLENHPEDRIQTFDPKEEGWYHRATPFSPRVHEKLLDLFRDLSYCPLDGILFQDDLYMNDFEDTSLAGREAFRQHFHKDMTPQLLKDPAICKEWAQVKGRALTDLTLKLAAEIHKFRPQAMIARNLYANVLLEEDAEDWMAQNYADMLKNYDQVVIMAYPYMEKAEDPQKWLTLLAKTALAPANAKSKAIFKLQAYDWEKKRWIPRAELVSQVKTLRQAGAVNISYYPVNIFDSTAKRYPY